MVLVYLPTKLGHTNGVTGGIHIPAPWFGHGMDKVYTYRSWWRLFLNCEVADKQKNIDLTGLDHATRDAAMVIWQWLT